MSEAARAARSILDRRHHSAGFDRDGLFKVPFVVRRDRRTTYVDWAIPSVADRLVDAPDRSAVALGQLLDRRRGRDGQAVGYLALDTEASVFVYVRIRDDHERDLEVEERDRLLATVLELANGERILK